MVYIDDARNPYGRMLMSHMVADEPSELHSMAESIGLKRKWFQDTRHPHYDVCQHKKRMAIELGAKEVTTKRLVGVIRLNNNKGG